MMSDSLSDLITAIAREARRAHKPGPRDSWYPSDIGQCDRKSVLRHAGIEGNPINDETARVFWIGDVIHKDVQTAIGLKLAGKVWHEVEVKDSTYMVSGRIDSLRLTDEGEWEVYEYKTARATAFNFELPKPEHVLQVSTYLTFPPTCPECIGYECVAPDCETCGNTGFLPLPSRARLIYISKEDGKIEEFVVTANETLTDKVQEVFARLQAMYEDYQTTGKLPPALAKVPLKVKGQIIRYVKTGAWGKAGDPKMVDDWRVRLCDYKGTGFCCGDNPAELHFQSKDGTDG